MDGLLVDSETIFRDSMFEICRQQGLKFSLEVFLRMVGAPRDQNRLVAMEHFGPDFAFDAWFETVGEHAHAQIAVDLKLKAGVIELIDFLDEAAIPRAVATSSSHASVERQLRPLGLIERFDAIVASGDYARGKPSPDPFLVALACLQVAPAACLALEDSHNGVRAAHAAGAMTVMVPDLLQATQEMQALTVHIAETLHEVRDMLREQRA